MTAPRQVPNQRVQLHRALSKLGWGSRKQAWGWIRNGEVCVDGRVETNPLAWVDLGRQQITREGTAPAAKRLVTLALHKPRGVVTTRSDERGRRTVYDLLQPEVPWVFPAGRLDADSEGLLILTNDSRLSVRLTDPNEHVPKRYEIMVRGRPTPETLDRLRAGVDLADGPTRPARLKVLRERGEDTLVEMTLTEGRNRQARRMWAAVGHRVRRLKRVAIGAYQLGELPPGQIRRLGPEDLGRLVEKRSPSSDIER